MILGMEQMFARHRLKIRALVLKKASETSWESEWNFSASFFFMPVVGERCSHVFLHPFFPPHRCPLTSPAGVIAGLAHFAMIRAEGTR